MSKTALRRPVKIEPRPPRFNRAGEGSSMVTLECGHVIRRSNYSLSTKRHRCPFCTEAKRKQVAA